MKQQLTHLGTTPSGKKVFLEKSPHEYRGFSKSDHRYAATLHQANRTRGGEIARLHRAAAGEIGSSRAGLSRAAHATKKDYDWSSFIDGAAFAFWASPYMSEVESIGEESREAYRALAPGSGGKWDDVIPEPPPSAYAVAKKFTKAARAQLSDEQLAEIASKFSAYEAGYRGAMQSQGEGIGWFDKGVRVDPPRGFDWDSKIHNAVARAISKGVREAGIKLPRR